MIDIRTFWWNLRNAARALFWHGERDPKAIRPILDELREFCHADSVPLAVDRNGATDLYQTGIIAGRLETWRRIQMILNLTDDQLNAMEKPSNE